MSSPPTSFYLITCVAVASISALQFGYHSGVINQPREAMTNCSIVDERWPRDCVPMSDWQWGAFVSIFLLGGVFGGLSGGHLASMLGRRSSLLYTNIHFLLGAALLSFGTSFAVLCLGRLFIGIGAGTGTVVLPLYISEISPAARRGLFGGVNQLSIVLGVLVSQIMGYSLSRPATWRILFMFTAVPCIIQLWLLRYCVESPRWLVSQGDRIGARKALQTLRGCVDVDDELTELLAVFNQLDDEFDVGSSGSLEPHSPLISQESIVPLSTVELFQTPSLVRPLAVAFGLQVAQQFSGINAAIYYSTTIFQQSFDPETAIRLTTFVSVINLVGTLASTMVIDRMGRKYMLLLSLLSMSLFAFGIVIAFQFDLSPLLMAVFLMCFVGGFSMGLGAIPWLIVPELLPQAAIGSASSICTALNWTSNLILAFFLPAAIAIAGYYVFLFFSMALLAFAIFTQLLMPETKGKTPEEVADSLDDL
ncbi:general substrate transporter [Polychytrium aggregatum]|uniref:general substrate transporter n=1 Tax=Polychytrium aggregatum TaxID=110093 RepID=UPI0022FF0524|nr:general substrate transporter [Polychytrium aggregatum]KAI9207953.1 general substrate transporter [Polychytrium aggregatum]